MDSSLGLGTIKGGVIFGLLNNPYLVRQLELLQPDQAISYVVILMIVTYFAKWGITSFSRIVPEQSLWRGLCNLVIVTIEPVISFMQMTIGMLLVKAILHYTNQGIVGYVTTTSTGFVLDAIMNYRTPIVPSLDKM